MSRSIEYRVDGGVAQSVTVAQPLDITGLTNDTEVDIEIRVTDGATVSNWSNVKAVTPTAPDVIEVDSMAGATDTDKIDNAIDKATDPLDADFGKEVHFSAKEYNYSGGKTLADDVTLVGTQPVYNEYDADNVFGYISDTTVTSPEARNQTTINVTGRWNFDADITIRGIWFDAGRNVKQPFYVGNGATLTGERLYLSGAYTDVNDYTVNGSSDGAYVLRVLNGDTATINLTDCKIFDAQWDGDLTTADAYPLARVVATGNAATTLDWTNVQVFGCCDDLTLYSGTRLIEDTQGITGYTQDIDMMNLNGDGTTSTIRNFTDVTLFDCPLSYWKISEGGGVYDVDGLTFRILSGKKNRGRLFRNQVGDYADINLEGDWTNVTIEIDDVADRVETGPNFERSLLNISGVAGSSGQFVINNLELKWTGALAQPLFTIGNNREDNANLKVNNAFSNGGSIRYGFYIWKLGHNTLSNAESNPHFYEIANCNNLSVDRAWFYDSVRVETFTFDGSNCRVWDEVNIRVTNTPDLNLVFIGVESDGADDTSDIFISNQEDDWQNTESCYGTPEDARIYQAY